MLYRSINKLIRVGRTEPVVVIRVDKDKGYIDLSKRRVSKEDIERCTEKYSKAKAVNSIVRHVAEILGFKSNEDLEALYKKTAWYFESKSKKQGTAYDYFKQAVADPKLLDDLGLDEKTKEVLLENIQRKLTQQAVKIRADFECSCYTYEGIDAVKDALLSNGFMKDGIPCHFASAVVAGVTATFVASPVDVVKTRSTHTLA